MRDDSRAGRAARAALTALRLRTEPTDPDVELSGPARTPQPASAPRPGAVLGVISVGGVLGALARYEAGLRWPTSPGHFPWTTLWINVLGCALLGVLMVVATDVVTDRPLLRPLLGTGVLGGFTTFSTFAVDSQRLIATGHAGLALSDLGVSVVAALAAVTIATRLARRAVTSVRS